MIYAKGEVMTDEQMTAYGWRKNADGTWERPGYDALWLWFGLSRASFLVMPRVFMHAMPDEWQSKMAALLEEWDEAWNWDDCGFDSTSVSVKKDNRFARMPEWAIDYRHPDYGVIKYMRRKTDGSDATPRT